MGRPPLRTEVGGTAARQRPIGLAVVLALTVFRAGVEGQEQMDEKAILWLQRYYKAGELAKKHSGCKRVEYLQKRELFCSDFRPGTIRREPVAAIHFRNQCVFPTGATIRSRRCCLLDVRDISRLQHSKRELPNSYKKHAFRYKRAAKHPRWLASRSR